MLDEIWPRTAERTADGALVIGGCDARALATEFGTPLFVVDELDIRARAAEYRAAYDDATNPFDVFYASKAFSSIGVARWVHEGRSAAHARVGAARAARKLEPCRRLGDVAGIPPA